MRFGDVTPCAHVRLLDCLNWNYQFALYNVAVCCLLDDAMSLLNDGLRTNFGLSFAQSVSRRSAILQICVLSAANLCVIYGRQRGTWTVFPPSTQTYVSGLLFLGSREY